MLDSKTAEIWLELTRTMITTDSFDRIREETFEIFPGQYVYNVLDSNVM